ncbi:hypothetical protein K6119_15310 [Paracrocinitomix mangrovi]|uniref:DUF7793 family protein n=1 Tax=Paracrocinitomix mangrovi TaxID=2862509 RepID=UPI001C8D6BA1|nr:hypothetical protein [Paracrocinitomix mangrovi]UKN01098.1 hypothetical protein K6119_15310 [Paracrocinitomix mangrovi]
MSYLKEVNIECAEIALLDSGIIQIRYKADYEVELKDVMEVEKVFIDFSESAEIFCLMDTSGRFNIFSKEAQKFLSNEASIVRENKLKGSAVVIDNLPNRIIAQFFSKFYKPQFPMKIFSSQEEGMKWLSMLKG